MDLSAADGSIDPHRPHIDRVELGCAACGGTMRRTPEVADAWFDSGAMPYEACQHREQTQNVLPKTKDPIIHCIIIDF